MLAYFWRFTLIRVILACLAAIIIHEVFHILAAFITGTALHSIRPTPVGIRASLKNTKSFKKQIFIYLAGPLGNLATAFMAGSSEGFLNDLFEASIAIGIFNLLPVYPLDGGQIFIIISYKLFGSARTFRLARSLAVVLKTLLVFAGLLQLVMFKNPSLLAAMVMLPGARLLKEAVSIMKLENLLNRKQRILKKGIYPAGIIVCLEDSTMGDVLQKLDHDRFHLVYIMNSDMELIGMVTEHDIIKAIEKYSSSDPIKKAISCNVSCHNSCNG